MDWRGISFYLTHTGLERSGPAFEVYRRGIAIFIGGPRPI